MLDIPEIDNIICKLLSVEDLDNCSQVSRQWRRIAIPHIWRDFSNLMYRRTTAFHRIVREDYLQQQQQRQQQQQQQQKVVQVQDPRQPSALANYCPWIRRMPPPNDILAYFQPSYKEDQDAKPTEFDLLRHFLSHCSNFVVDYLPLNCGDYESESLLEITAEFVLPHVRNLDIGLVEYAFGTMGCQTPRKFKHLLSRCSAKLEKLTLNCDMIDNVDDVDEGANVGEREEESSFAPKELVLESHEENPKLSKFWSWLWSRCGRLERLHVFETEGTVDCLASGMLAHMPNLCKIHLGRTSDWRHSNILKEEEIVALLSSCRNGWKVVDIGHNYTFGEASVAVLEQHYRTLETLVVGGGNFKSKDLLLLLSSAPNLRTLVAIDDGHYKEPLHTSIDAAMFIDLEPGTNSLRPWACENTLKELKIRITNIPRPDLRKRRGVVQEEYAGQGKDIQSRVYERLARFTKLEKLWLGSSPAIGKLPYTRETEREQRDCLEMSLESGLHRLAGLKEMRELSAANINSKIGFQEVQWMAENWPKLRIIRRLKGAERKRKRRSNSGSGASFGGDESEYDEDEDKKACKEYLEMVMWSLRQTSNIVIVGSCDALI